MLHPWKHSRLGWTGLWATWSSWRCPCSLQGGWARWPLNLPSNPRHSMILWFQIKRWEDMVWISYQASSGLSTVWDMAQWRPVKAVPTACRTALLPLSTHAHANHGLYLWGMSGKRTCRAKLLQKSLCLFAPHGCFSRLRSYTSLWRLFAAKPSTCSAIRHSLPPDLCHTVWWLFRQLQQKLPSLGNFLLPLRRLLVSRVQFIKKERVNQPLGSL